MTDPDKIYRCPKDYADKMGAVKAQHIERLEKALIRCRMWSSIALGLALLAILVEVLL